MFPSLEAKLDRYEELEQLLYDPEVQKDVTRMVEIQVEMGGLQRIAKAVRAHRELVEEIDAAKEMLDEETDAEAKQYAQAELDELEKQRTAMEPELEELAASGDALTRGSLIMEIRAGAGGDEAALFARNLYDMYIRLCETRGWKVETIEYNPTELGGIKEVVFNVSGEACYHQLQFESGGHRVQRVPETESQGRVHTSAATVAVMAEPTAVEVEIKDEDIKVDTMRAGGPGGQKVNKTESAVRMTHLPTGIVVKCQDEKSQHKNRASAMRVLRSRVLEARQQAINDERSETRKTLVGSGDRSQRIRTYNFPQNRITDHRIGYTLHKLDKVIQGDMDELIDAMIEFDRMERLGLDPKSKEKKDKKSDDKKEDAND
jgi:peptide chain release factor 1